MTDAAAQLRAQKAASTDPARLERMAREVEAEHGAAWPCARCGHQRGEDDKRCPYPLCSHDI